MIIILCFIGFSLLVSTLWGVWSTYKLSSKKDRDRTLSDPRYYELKYKYEFLVAVFTIIVAFITILGYNSVEKIEEALTERFRIKTDSTNQALMKIVKRTDSLNEAVEKNLRFVNSESESIKEQMAYTKKEIKFTSINLEQLLRDKGIVERDMKILLPRIDSIYKAHGNKVNMFFIDYFKFHPTSESTGVVYFKELLTNTGNRLPQFTKPPFVQMFSEWGNYGDLSKKIYCDSLIVYSVGPDEKFKLLIIENP